MELAQRDLNDEVDELHERIRELEMRRALKFGKKFAVLKRPARKIARKKFAQPTRAAA